MEISEEIEKALADLQAEWNKAENAIKLAEQVNGEIINPAIYELRYGGRRLVEALSKVTEGNQGPAVLNLLRDAHFDCCRARHDAIDAATSKVVSDLDIAIGRLGADAVLSSYPNFPGLVRKLGDVRDRIATSRQNRDDRDAIYSVLEATNLPNIIADYRDFRANEPIMKLYAKQQRTRLLVSYGIAFVGLLIGIIGWFR